MKRTITFLFLGLTLGANAQNNSVEKSMFGIQTGLVGIWLNNESKLSNSIALRTEIGIEHDFTVGDHYDGAGFILQPVLTIEPRYYYNLDKRNTKGYVTTKNSGNYISIKTSYHPDWFVLGLDDHGEVFTTVSPSLSEFISQQDLIIGETNSELEVKNRSKGYFNSESINQRPLNVFQGIKTKEQTKQEGEESKSSSHTIEFENPTNSLFVIENPLTKTLKDLTVEKTRDYPIELDFPYLATIMFRTRLPQNYKMETDQFSRKISAFNGSLQYLQEVKSDKDDQFLTWSLLINKTVFQNNEIQEYQQFITQLESVFSEVAVIKMIK